MLFDALTWAPFMTYRLRGTRVLDGGGKKDGLRHGAPYQKAGHIVVRLARRKVEKRITRLIGAID